MKYIKQIKSPAVKGLQRYHVDISKEYIINGFSEVLTFKILDVEASGIVEGIDKAFTVMKDEGVVDKKAKYITKDYYADDNVERILLRSIKDGDDIIFTISRNKVEAEDGLRVLKPFASVMYREGHLMYKTLEIEAVDGWDALKKVIDFYKSSGEVEAWSYGLTEGNKIKAKALSMITGMPNRVNLLIMSL